MKKRLYIKSVFFILITVLVSLIMTSCSDENKIYYELTSNGKGYKIVDASIKKKETSLVIPEIYNDLPIIEIDAGAFDDCENLIKIKIPKTVKKIGRYAFSGSFNLTEINGAEGLTYIDSYAFAACTALNKFSIPEGITEIKDFTFHGCSSLNSISIPNSVTRIGDYSFRYCINLTNLTLSENLISIGKNAFEHCYKLIEICNDSNIIINSGSDKNGYIAYYADNIYSSFEGESKLSKDNNGFVFYSKKDINYLISYVGTNTQFALPENFDNQNYAIYKYAFRNNKDITSVLISDGVTEIGAHAFENCSNLKDVFISISVKKIGAYALTNCHHELNINAEKEKIAFNQNEYDWHNNWTSDNAIINWNSKKSK